MCPSHLTTQNIGILDIYPSMRFDMILIIMLGACPASSNMSSSEIAFFPFLTVSGGRRAVWQRRLGPRHGGAVTHRPSRALRANADADEGEQRLGRPHRSLERSQGPSSWPAAVEGRCPGGVFSQHGPRR